MLRSLFVISALFVTAAPAAAAVYSAKPAVASPAKIAARDILWKCADGTCSGSTPNSRPVVLCQGLAKKAGRIDAFAVDGRAITAAELEQCNASAKPAAAEAVATAR